jgi:hypothetical protein
MKLSQLIRFQFQANKMTEAMHTELVYLLAYIMARVGNRSSILWFSWNLEENV